MFAGAPLSAVFTGSSRARLAWWDKCTWRTPSGITINDIHDHPGAKQMEVKEDIGLIVMQDLSNGSSHTISAHFLET